MLRPLVLFLLAASAASAQVNTERMRTARDSAGVTLQADASFAYATGNTNFLIAGVGGRLDVVRRSFESFLVGRASVSRADDVVFLNQSFAHLRFTRDLGGPLAVEAFAQAEQNAQRLLQERFLGGAGLRLTLADSDAGRLAFGLTPMVEFERLDAETGEPDATLVRLSHYLATRLQISEWAAVSNIVYAQPAVGAWGDVRVLNDLTLDVELARGVAVRTAAHLRYDSQPPPDVAKTDVEVRNGLVIALPAR